MAGQARRVPESSPSQVVLYQQLSTNEHGNCRVLSHDCRATLCDNTRQFATILSSDYQRFAITPLFRTPQSAVKRRRGPRRWTSMPNRCIRRYAVDRVTPSATATAFTSPANFASSASNSRRCDAYAAEGISDKTPPAGAKARSTCISVMAGPSDRSAANAIVCRNSRTLPGQSCCSSRRIALGVTRTVGFAGSLVSTRAKYAARCPISSG